MVTLIKPDHWSITKPQLHVPNYFAEDSSIKGVLYEVDDQLNKRLRSGQINPKPLLVCSGGTSSRCAAEGHLTLDLRKNYSTFHFDNQSRCLEIGGGITMGSISKELSKFGRSFPIGLSGQTGMGFILTGGISPLSRTMGLAIDQITEINGVWGQGESFKINKPSTSSSIEERLTWRALCGAAPFLGIITSLKVETHPIKPLTFWEARITPSQLAKLIQKAEKWPNSSSLQWIWGDEIHAYGISQINKQNTKLIMRNIQELIPGANNLKFKTIIGLHDMPKLSISSIRSKQIYRSHSEVVGLLGPSWGESSAAVVNMLEELIKERPDPRCYVAAQQLGGTVKNTNRELTSFIHRNSIWKPWITASWPANDTELKTMSLDWLEKVWEKLTPVCPGVHLAQMHPHLSWHKKEIRYAFEDWLPGLKDLKSRFDPNGLLTPL